MASWSPIDTLHSEASCPICLGLFQDPVSIHCGHNLCRGCISRCWEWSGPFSCPGCREAAPERSFRPSRELGSIARVAARMGAKATCPEHQEPQKLFCKVELSPICVVCERSRAHRFHAVVPVEEAAQEYKEEIQARLQALKEERGKFLESRRSGKTGSSYLVGAFDGSLSPCFRRKKIVDEFERLCQFLKEQEHLLLSQLEDLDWAIMKVQEEADNKIMEDVSHLDTLIWEMEGKFQQPPSEFLQ
ncbi:Zinc finger protein RFP, partial [Tinamus guttatus]